MIKKHLTLAIKRKNNLKQNIIKKIYHSVSGKCVRITFGKLC